MLNERIHSSRRSVTQIVSAAKDQSFFIDSSFQRKLIWTEKQKIKLIETVLMGYPMPEIYLWKQPPDPASGDQKSSIVDGQQRINAIWSFIDGEFKLKKSALEKSNQERSYANCSWVELNADHKSQIWSYELNARSFPADISKTEIRSVFVRLNETDRSLNPQEMRNAKFHGEFLKASEVVADHAIWREKKVFSPNDTRRMKDVEFSSTLLSFLRNGISSDTASSLNDTYERFSDSYSKKSADITVSTEILDRLSHLIETSGEAKTYLTKETHLYTFFVIDFRLRSQDKVIPPGRVEEFFQLYREFSNDPDIEMDANIANIMRLYLRGSSSRIRSKSSREQRVFAVLDYLDL